MLCEFEAIIRKVVASFLFGVLPVNLFCLKSVTDMFFSKYFNSLLVARPKHLVAWILRMEVFLEKFKSIIFWLTLFPSRLRSYQVGSYCKDLRSHCNRTQNPRWTIVHCDGESPTIQDCLFYWYIWQCCINIITFFIYLIDVWMRPENCVIFFLKSDHNSLPIHHKNLFWITQTAMKIVVFIFHNKDGKKRKA